MLKRTKVMLFRLLNGGEEGIGKRGDRKNGRQEERYSE